MRTCITAISTFLLVISLTACGSSRTAAPTEATLGTPTDTSSRQAGGQRWDAQWEAVLADPGVPGEDYDPGTILVSYPPGRSASALSGPKSGGPSVAAAHPNAILRENRQYEALTDAIVAAFGLEIDQQVYVDELNFASFYVPEGTDGDALLEGIRAQFGSEIEYATYCRLFFADFDVNDPWYNQSNPNGAPGNAMLNHPQWGQKRIGCSEAWDYTLGEPAVRVAVVDTGVRLSHQELGQVLDPTVHFPGDNLNVRDNNNNVSDADGHGTFIAGIVAATGNNNRTMIGVAPQCEVIPIKISQTGVATDARMASGCTLAMQLGSRSVNLSWGREGGGSPTLANMVNTLFNNDVLLAISSGNDGTTVQTWPASYQNAFSVGSTDRNDARSDFSNYHLTVDIAAPGEWLRSAGPGSDTEYVGPQQGNGFGTSYSAPMVAAVAGLMLSLAPDLTVVELRTIMLDTAVPTNGFTQGPVPRLNAAAAVAAVSGTIVKAPRPTRLIHSGVVQLTPGLVGLPPDSVELRFNGAHVATKTAAPWDFSVDTSLVSFGIGNCEFIASSGAEESRASLELLIDNSTAIFPLQENYDTTTKRMVGYDAKVLAGAVQTELYQNIPVPSEDAFSTSGPATWRPLTSGSHAGPQGMYCGNDSSSYGANELDCLVSRKLALGANPTLVFYQHYNIEDGDAGQGWDRGWVLVTPDNGQTFQQAKLRHSGAPSFYTGNQPAWTKAEVDLSDFAGQTVHLVLSLQSDGDVAGQVAGTAGWWVDTLTLATNYNETVPTIGGVNVADYSLRGTVPALPSLDVAIQQPVNVAWARFILDVSPLDPIIQIKNAAPFTAEIALPTNVRNQIANLRVQYFDANNAGGTEFTIPIYIFNQLGDVNGDGKVNAADLAAFESKLGLTSADPGYVPFYDSNLDGVINEADTSAVGYFWKP